MTKDEKMAQMRTALEQAQAWLERQMAIATGGAELSDVDYAANFNAVLEQIEAALDDGDVTAASH